MYANEYDEAYTVKVCLEIKHFLNTSCLKALNMIRIMILDG